MAVKFEADIKLVAEVAKALGLNVELVESSEHAYRILRKDGTYKLLVADGDGSALTECKDGG